MKKSIAVLGLGKFGTSIVEECYDIGCEVLAVDINKERVQAVSPYATYCAQVDVRDKESLRSLGISNVDAVVVAITGDLESSILGTLNVKELGIQQIIAKVKDETQSTILKRIGATDTIIPEKEAGINMARRLASQNILEYIDLQSLDFLGLTFGGRYTSGTGGSSRDGSSLHRFVRSMIHIIWQSLPHWSVLDCPGGMHRHTQTEPETGYPPLLRYLLNPSECLHLRLIASLRQ